MNGDEVKEVFLAVFLQRKSSSEWRMRSQSIKKFMPTCGTINKLFPKTVEDVEHENKLTRIKGGAESFAFFKCIEN